MLLVVMRSWSLNQLDLVRLGVRNELTGEGLAEEVVVRLPAQPCQVDLQTRLLGLNGVAATFHAAGIGAVEDQVGDTLRVPGGETDGDGPAL